MTSQTADLSPEEKRRSVEDRADRSWRATEAARQAYEAEREIRDQVAVDLIDTGHTVVDTAARLHISKARVHQLLARRG